VRRQTKKRKKAATDCTWGRGEGGTEAGAQKRSDECKNRSRSGQGPRGEGEARENGEARSDRRKTKGRGKPESSQAEQRQKGWDRGKAWRPRAVEEKRGKSKNNADEGRERM